MKAYKLFALASISMLLASCFARRDCRGLSESEKTKTGETEEKKRNKMEAQSSTRCILCFPGRLCIVCIVVVGPISTAPAPAPKAEGPTATCDLPNLGFRIPTSYQENSTAYHVPGYEKRQKLLSFMVHSA